LLRLKVTACLLVAAGLLLAAARFHVVSTRNGLVVLSKWRPSLGDVYVDARPPEFAAAAHPDLDLTLLFRGRTDVIAPQLARAGGPGSSAPTVSEALARGLDYLEAQQQPDGSWRYFASASPDFSVVNEQPRIFPANIIALSLKHLAAGRSKVLARARGYLRSEMRDDFLWTHDGLTHELTHKWGRLPCRLLPDADNTSLAWLLVGEDLGREALTRVHAVFQRHERADGTYPSWFTAVKESNPCPPDYGNRPPPGLNINVLAFFERYGIDSSRLRRGLATMLARTKNWEQHPYHGKPSVLAFLAAAAVVEGAVSAEPFLDRFLDDARAAARPTALEKGAYVAAASDRCRRQRLDCGRPQADIDELLRSQRPDGSWPAGPLYRTSRLYYGSPAETTAIALRGLDAWSQTQRADLQAGGFSPSPPR
jgi:hypothetical protein